MGELLDYIKCERKFAPADISCMDNDCGGTMHKKTYNERCGIVFTDGAYEWTKTPDSKQYYKCDTCAGVHLARKLPNKSYNVYG